MNLKSLIYAGPTLAGYSSLRRASGLTFTDWRRLRASRRYLPGVLRLFGRPIRYADAVTLLEGLQQIFVQQTYAFPATGDSPLILDCGANIGLATLFFKQWHSDATVISFEADPAIFELLVSNVAGLQNVVVNNLAVWNEEGEVIFRCEGGASGRIARGADNQSLTRVKAARLRNYLQQPVALLKMDVEGAEYEVIKDCSDSLGNVHRAFIEYHGAANEPQRLHDLLAIISGAGFRYHVKDAHTAQRPFMNRSPLTGNDLQLDIFAFRDF